MIRCSQESRKRLVAIGVLSPDVDAFNLLPTHTGRAILSFMISEIQNNGHYWLECSAVLIFASHTAMSCKWHDRIFPSVRPVQWNGRTFENI